MMQAFVPDLPYNMLNDFFALDARALLFTFAISLATGVIFGLAPAWHASNPDIVPVLKGIPAMLSQEKRVASACETRW